MHGRLPGTENCRNCHTEHKGHDASIIAFAYANVDHLGMAGFSLSLHKTDYHDNNMECHSCHDQATFEPHMENCVACHEEEDAAQMALHLEEFGQDCVACHDGLDTLASFGHEIVYELDGGHTEVACAVCHQGGIFAGTPTACHACHDFPAVHGDHFGDECTRCHSTVAWQPAQLTRHTFQLGHANQEGIVCQSCHVANYLSYSCAGCHDQEPAAMQLAHAQAGVTNVERCAECHPTGIAGEGLQQMQRLGLSTLATPVAGAAVEQPDSASPAAWPADDPAGRRSSGQIEQEAQQAQPENGPGDASLDVAPGSVQGNPKGNRRVAP